MPANFLDMYASTISSSLIIFCVSLDNMYTKYYLNITTVSNTYSDRNGMTSSPSQPGWLRQYLPVWLPAWLEVTVRTSAAPIVKRTETTPYTVGPPACLAPVARQALSYVWRKTSVFLIIMLLFLCTYLYDIYFLYIKISND